MRLVLVEWLDSFGCSSDWQELADDYHPKPVVCKSVGWLFSDGPECAVIVPHITISTQDTTQQGCGDMTIPTKCILHMFDLVQVSPASK